MMSVVCFCLFLSVCKFDVACYLWPVEVHIWYVYSLRKAPLEESEVDLLLTLTLTLWPQITLHGHKNISCFYIEFTESSGYWNCDHGCAGDIIFNEQSLCLFVQRYCFCNVTYILALLLISSGKTVYSFP